MLIAKLIFSLLVAILFAYPIIMNILLVMTISGGVTLLATFTEPRVGQVAIPIRRAKSQGFKRLDANIFPPLNTDIFPPLNDDIFEDNNEHWQ